jgi:hypothetical protein
MASRLSPADKRHIPAIGPGAKRKRPHGAYLAEQGKYRVSPRPTYRFGFCPGRSSCPGHAFIVDGADTGAGCE